MEARPRFTVRCDRDDLPNLPADITRGIFRKVQNRIDTGSIETGTRYEAVPVPKMFTEHQGDHRAVTWWDAPRGIVWICAAGSHAVYDEAKRLFEQERLLPAREDFVAAEAELLQIEMQRSAEMLAHLRSAIDRDAAVTDTICGQLVRLTRHEPGFYEVRLPIDASDSVALLILATVFPDQIDVEWSTPERDHEGRLTRGIFVMTSS